MPNRRKSPAPTFVLVAASAALLPGCGGPRLTQAVPDPARSAIPGLVEKYSGGEQLDEVPYADLYSMLPKGLRDAYETADVDGRTRIRNAVLADFLTLGFAVHAEKERLLYRSRAGLNTTLDIAGITTAALAAVFQNPATTTALAAASTVAQGTKDSITKNYFFDRASDAVIAKMREAQAEQELVIRANMLKPADAYSLEMALVDGVDFLFVGTVTAALAEIVADAERGRAEVEQRVQKLKETGTLVASFNSEPEAQSLQDELAALALGESAEARANQRRLNEWLKERGIEQRASTWIFTATTDELRQAVAFLKGGS